MCIFAAIALTLCSILFGLTDCTSSYDQRQTGDLNVQIGLKNIQLIALMKGGSEDYVNYDYAYDYSEMTIKPQNGVTLKPLNVTIAQMQSNGTSTSPVSAENVTEPDIIATQRPINSSTPQNFTSLLAQNVNISEANINTTPTYINETTDALEVINQPVSNVSTNYSANKDTEMVTTDPSVAVGLSEDLVNGTSAVQSDSPSHCRRGFVRNHQGKCEYKVHGTTNALRRIVNLAQKIKIGRGYKET